MRSNMKNIIFPAFLALFMSGCAQQSFVMSNSHGELKKTETQHLFVNGIAQEKEINAAKVCGGIKNVSKVEVQQTLSNVVLDVLTLGIYTPREARIYCQ